MAANPTPDTRPAAAGDGRIRVRLDAVRRVAEGVHTFELRRPDGAPLPAWAPGAHVDLHLPNGLTRQYSLCGDPDDRSCWTVGVKRDPASRGGSAWLFERLRVGEALDAGGPRNLFPLDEEAPVSVLIAGGIGVTPIVAMAERLAALGRDWSMTYAVRRRAEAAFADRLSRHGTRVRLHVDEAHGGRPVDVAALVAAAPADAQLYCCGPAPMLDAFESAAAARPRGRVHVERFAATAAPATAGGYVVELARSGRRVTVSPGQTIVDALRTIGVDVAVSCAQGICGTCETRVLAGVPDHRDSLLSDAERAANDVMMICCSGSLTGTLTLDL